MLNFPLLNPKGENLEERSWEKSQFIEWKKAAATYVQRTSTILESESDAPHNKHSLQFLLLQNDNIWGYGFPRGSLGNKIGRQVPFINLNSALPPSISTEGSIHGNDITCAQRKLRNGAGSSINSNTCRKRIANSPQTQSSCGKPTIPNTSRHFSMTSPFQFFV